MKIDIYSKEHAELVGKIMLTIIHEMADIFNNDSTKSPYDDPRIQQDFCILGKTIISNLLEHQDLNPHEDFVIRMSLRKENET